MTTTGLEISELTTPDAIVAAFDLMSMLRPHLTRDTFVDQVTAQHCDGYRLIGGHIEGRLVALAGFRFARTLARGPHLFVDDLVTAAAEQGKGYGAAMLE